MRGLLLLLPLLLAVSCSKRTPAELQRKEALMHLDLRSDTLSEFAEPYSGPLPPAQPLRTNPVGAYAETFNDSNYLHWQEAEKIGIEPLTDLRSHWQLKNPIVKIASCADFYLEPLTHSAPFMVREGAERIHEIGRRFRDSLQARGGGDYRIRVTSVTRTALNVRRLRRRNRNAIDSSVHQLGTTFDISYSSFIPNRGTKTARTDAQLKALLAEVLLAMRNEGKILVKYEKKQPCFHITATKCSKP